MFGEELGPFQHNTEEWHQFTHAISTELPLHTVGTVLPICASEPSPHPAYILNVFHSKVTEVQVKLWEHKGAKCWAGQGNKFYPHFTDNDSEIQESSALLHHSVRP